MGHLVEDKLGLGGLSGYVVPLDQSEPLQCALCKHLQQQVESGLPILEIDPYGLPAGLCEAHLFQLVMFAETELGIQQGECTIAIVLERSGELFPLAA